jgi:hypothetical protein
MKRAAGTAILVFVATSMATAGCYHAVVDTGRTPNGTVIEDEWADSFVDGLAPPDVINTAEDCPNGIAKVETRHSFLNRLAAFLTFSIYSPMHITVHCAAAGEADAAADRTVEVGAGSDTRAIGVAIAKAAILADRADAPAFVVIAE